MNIASAKLLQDSLQNAAENVLRNRQLKQAGELAAQRNAVEQSFRNAMMQHYNQMEERQQGFYNKMQQEDQERGVLGEQNIAREQQQNALAEKQNILRVAMQLNATGQLTDKSRDGVNHWLSTDSDMSKSGIQLAPTPNASTDPGSIQTALAQGIALREKYQSIADTAKDPAQKANALKVIGIIDANLGGKGAPQRQDETDTETAGTDPAGNATRTITKHFGEMPQSPAPTSVPDNRPWYDRLFNVGQVPVPQNAPASGATPLTPSLGVSPTNANGIPTGQPPGGSATGQPNPADVQWLSANPTPGRVAQFEGKYGKGSSAQFLNLQSQAATGASTQ